MDDHFNGRSAADEFAEEAIRVHREKTGRAESGKSGQVNWKLKLVAASAITPGPIAWLWNGWLARGKLQILAGVPGTGKTTIAVKMGATVSMGGKWPDGTRSKQGKVVIWSGEDGAGDTLVPRLECSGADMDEVFFAHSVERGDEERPFDPAKDIDALRAALHEKGDVALLIVDPIVSATTADSHKNSETRRGLQPLVDLAIENNCALLGITHFTKGTEGRSPLDRVTGSLAFGAIARIVLVAAKEEPKEGEQERRVIMRAKSNIGPDDGGFGYGLTKIPMIEHPDIIASIVEWGDKIEGSAREILASVETQPDEEKESAQGQAEDFLRDILSGGAVEMKVIKREAADAGLSWASVRRANAALHVKARKKLGDGNWTWEQPKVVQHAQGAQGAQHFGEGKFEQHVVNFVGPYDFGQGAQKPLPKKDEHVEHLEHVAAQQSDADGIWEVQI